jgi:hypothetical protein
MKSRAFTDDDWPEFERFAAKHFGPSHMTDRRFNEHWFRTPWYDSWAARVIQNAEGRVIGMMMTIVVPAKLGDQVVPLAWISSAAVEDAARERGTGAALYLWVYKTFPLVGAMSSYENSLPLHALLGRNIPGVKMRRFICVHDKRAANLCLPANRSAVLAAVRSPLPNLEGVLSARWSTGIPSGYDQLWERVRDRFVCTTERNREYMEWRYVRAPYVEYRLLEMRLRDALHALAALRFQRTPEGMVCRVLDLIADAHLSTEAWHAVLNAARQEGALFSDFMVIGTDQDRNLRGAGFLPADGQTGLEAIPHLLSPVEHRGWSNTFHIGGRLAKADESWRRPEAVYFTKADSDRDWPTTYDLALRPAKV